MWSSSVASRGVRIGLSNLRSTGSWRGLSSAGAPPLGEGPLQFRTTRYRSFWGNLKQQKEGLANMALCASVAVLAIGLIRRDKELMHANESVERLKQENEALTKRLDGWRAVLENSEAGQKPEKDIVALLQDVLDLTDESRVDSPAEIDDHAQSTSGSKFMV